MMLDKEEIENSKYLHVGRARDIENRKDRQSKAQEIMESIEKSTPIKYRIQKWAFIIGISLMLVSRSATPVYSLIK